MDATTSAPTVVEAPAQPAAEAAHESSHTWEGELSAGFASWAGGGPAGASPGFVGSLAFGVVPSWARGERVALRLAGRASVWSAAEPERRTTIVPLLLEPSMQIALGATAVTLVIACGVGVAVFPSLDARSQLLTEDAARVTGALSALEVRPSLSFRWALSPATAVALTAAYAWDGRLDSYFRARSLQRLEASLGVVQRW